ncbi:MAG: serine hydroxymethyltransferase [Candidatus Stahlbacteria bacterium]|nr:serine hydroxymethyltransferase [Candidatus Stahlbacteria bacterium]
MQLLKKADPEIYEAIKSELGRERSNLELIASENFPSISVLLAQGSLMQNKYAEGYPHRRYYGGCEFMDRVEELAIERAKKIFSAEHINVQPLSGVPANMAAYFTLANFGDTIMGLALPHGGHLSHGHSVSFSGKWFKVVHYTVDQDTEVINYTTLRELALQEKPKIIVSGASAYPRTLYFDKFREICDEVGAYLVADISHIAGLVAAGLHPSPIPYSDIVTTTTHKTLRGPRSAIIMCKEKWAKDVDKWVFPGIHGGPHMHTIAAKAVCFKEALEPEFKEYQLQVIKNAKSMEMELKHLNYRLVANGTDNHLLLVDLRSKGVTGKDAEESLARANITVNRNTIPYDPQKPFIASGIRIGTPALTSRGMKEQEMKKICTLMDKVLTNIQSEQIIKNVKEEVNELCNAFPLYPELDNIG